MTTFFPLAPGCLRFLTKTGKVASRPTRPGDSYCIYGAGGRGLQALQTMRRVCPTARFRGFLDSENAGELDGHPVLPLDAFRNIMDEVNLVVIASHWCDEMSTSLDALGYHAHVTAVHEDGSELVSHLRDMYPQHFEEVLTEVNLDEGDRTLEIDLGWKEPTGWQEGMVRMSLDALGQVSHPVSTRQTLSDIQFSEVSDRAGRTIIFLETQTTPIRPRYVPSTWVDPKLSRGERERAKQLWGGFATGDTDGDRAKSIARGLIDALEPNRGVPREPEGHPIDLYENALSGRDKVHCGPMASIFNFACQALGLMTRVVEFGNCVVEGVDASVYAGMGHWANEVFCREKRAWRLLDLTSYAVSFRFAGTADLTAFDLLHFFNSPHRDNVSWQLHLPEGVTKEQADLSIRRFYGSVNQRMRILWPHQIRFS